jgi:hypothetical protein
MSISTAWPQCPGATGFELVSTYSLPRCPFRSPGPCFEGFLRASVRHPTRSVLVRAMTEATFKMIGTELSPPRLGRREDREYGPGAEPEGVRVIEQFQERSAAIVPRGSNSTDILFTSARE